MKTVQHTAFLKDGRVHIRHRALFDKLCAQFREGTELLVTVERWSANRSVEANRYYFGVLVKALSEHGGQNKREAHEILKQLFLPQLVVIPTVQGEIVAELAIGGSTRALSVNEFWEYTESIRAWEVGELGLVLPERDPDRLVEL